MIQYQEHCPPQTKLDCQSHVPRSSRSCLRTVKRDQTLTETVALRPWRWRRSIHVSRQNAVSTLTWRARIHGVSGSRLLSPALHDRRTELDACALGSGPTSFPRSWTRKSWMTRRAAQAGFGICRATCSASLGCESRLPPVPSKIRPGLNNCAGDVSEQGSTAVANKCHYMPASSCKVLPTHQSTTTEALIED